MTQPIATSNRIGKPSWAPAPLPLKYLCTSSTPSLESFELARLNAIANLRKELCEVLGEWVEAEIQSRLAHKLLQRAESEGIALAPADLKLAQPQRAARRPAAPNRTAQYLAAPNRVEQEPPKPTLVRPTRRIHPPRAPFAAAPNRLEREPAKPALVRPTRRIHPARAPCAAAPRPPTLESFPNSRPGNFYQLSTLLFGRRRKSQNRPAALAQ